MLTVCTVVSITAKPSPPAAHPLPYRRVQLLGLGDEQLVQCVATDEAVLEQVMVSSLCLRLPNTAHPLKQRYQQVDRYPRTITATNRVSESPSQQLKQVDVEWPAQWGMFSARSTGDTPPILAHLGLPPPGESKLADDADGSGLLSGTVGGQRVMGCDVAAHHGVHSPPTRRCRGVSISFADDRVWSTACSLFCSFSHVASAFTWNAL